MNYYIFHHNDLDGRCAASVVLGYLKNNMGVSDPVIKETDYNHVVYLMCDKNYRFRIGKIPFVSKGHKGLNPWRQKMLNEGCEKIWILDVFKTDKEARLLETKLSYQYQIPQTCWPTNKITFTKEDIDYIYDGLDTRKNAEECLKAFHKDINYPLVDISL